jgi:hypothetical protein
MIVIYARRDAVDAGHVVARFWRADERRGGVRRSRVVLTPRCWRQVARNYFHAATVTTKPGHRGEHEGNRKTIVQGMPVETGEPVATTRAFFAPTGASDTRHSLRPLFWAELCLQTSGAVRRENEKSRVAHPSRRAQERAPQDEVSLEQRPHGEEAPTGPREARPDDRLRAVSNHEDKTRPAPSGASRNDRTCNDERRPKSACPHRASTR